MRDNPLLGLTFILVPFSLLSIGGGPSIFAPLQREVVDVMQNWFETGACDGFNILPPFYLGGLEDFVNMVTPELQRRGLFRTAYEGTTFRDILGIPTPVSRYAAKD